MADSKILAFAGSARQDSYNKKLIKIAARGAQEGGAEVTLIDLADFPLPLFARLMVFVVDSFSDVGSADERRPRSNRSTKVGNPTA